MDLSNFTFHSDDTSDLVPHCLLSRLIPIMTKLNHILIIGIRYEQKGFDPFFFRIDISPLSTSRLINAKIFCVVVILAPAVMFAVAAVLLAVGVMLAAARMLAMVLMLDITMHLVRLGIAPR